MSFKVQYWGVRGSLPSAPPPNIWINDFNLLMQRFFQKGYTKPEQIKQFISEMSVPEVGGYGSHTTCVEVSTDKAQIILDGGSGLKNLGDQMMAGPCGKGRGVCHIFLTHFHWDHLIGIPFFAPHFVPGNEIHYYAVQGDLESIVRMKFRKPMFPVPFEALGAKVHFHSLEPRKKIRLGDLDIVPYMLDHPDPCWGFRIESQGKSYAHCIDTEGTRTSREALGLDLPLYQNADLMYWDAQYTLPELAEKANWGHSAAQLGLDIAFRENIKRVLFAHHDPGAETSHIIDLRKQTQDYYDWKIKSSESNRISINHLKWKFAFEGLVVDLLSED